MAVHRSLRRHLLCAALALPVLAACDNVGRAFDPIVTPGGNGNSSTSAVQVVPPGGDAIDARPRIVRVVPSGGGWARTVPILVEFSESVNEPSMRPSSTTATDGRLHVRVQGTTTALPALYDFLDGGRVAVLRPTPELAPDPNIVYEIVLKPDARDSDGVRFQGSEDTVLGEFSVVEDAGEDGNIVAVLPRPNARDQFRDRDVIVVFDRPADPGTVVAASMSLRPAGGTAVAATLVQPLEVAGIGDPRAFAIDPTGLLAASTDHELVLTADIEFGDTGHLNFENRTPFSSFRTLPFASVTAITVGNPTPGFDDKINRGNLANLMLHVTTPDSALAGDRVVARIYGLDATTTTSGDLTFAERSVELTAAGIQTVTVDFTGELGTLSRPQFEDGSVTLAAQLQRGSLHSGVVHGAGVARFDITVPTLTRLWPAGSTTGVDAVSELGHLTLFGTANERLGAATLTDGTNTVGLFAAASSGNFVLEPLPLGILAAPASYSLTVTDQSGNMVAAPVTGAILQRGAVTGTLAGTLTVEAFDEATLLPVANCNVLLDPGVPQVPPVGRLTAVTGADGRATFTGLAGSSYTITLAHDSYHLRSLYDSPVAFASLPLRPRNGATATFGGTLQVTAVPGATALVGNNLYDDRALAVQTTTSATTTIPPTAVQPNRPQVVSVFAGIFEPTGVPSFLAYNFQMCGSNFLTPTVPVAPIEPGNTATPGLSLAVIGNTIQVLAPFNKDFALANGLDTANLVGGKPQVRATQSLLGFGGQSLIGVGFTTAIGGSNYTITGSVSAVAGATLADYTPISFTVTEARDTGGRISRHRALLDPIAGSHLDLLNAPSIPVITPPGGPSTAAPSVAIADEVDPTVFTGALAVSELLAQDAGGRQWNVLIVDNDAAGATDSYQFPSLAGSGVTGLQNGNWAIRAESRTFYSASMTATNLLLAERHRMEVTFARSASVNFTVQ